MIRLYDYQIDAVKKMRNGCILNGGVGSGKSLTSLAYYYIQNGGDWSSLDGGEYMPMDDVNMKDLYIITTAQKRDTCEWEGELSHFLMSTNSEVSLYPKHKVVVDSWNNIDKYKNVTGAFFLFDEQRVCGSGAWVKNFLKITKVNDWILLSATPGDCWTDFIPVFIANGFYRNKTEFIDNHVIYKRFAKFPQIDRYVNTGRLIRLRDRILINMDFERKTRAHHEDVYVRYSIENYKDVIRYKTDPFHAGYIPCRETDPEGLRVGYDIDISETVPIMDGWNYKPKHGDYVKWVKKPIATASELCYTLRKIVNTDDSRLVALMEIVEKHPRAIIFYNFDYELDLLKAQYYGEDVEIAEWNGHKHQPVPDSDKWIYLVQYNAGNAGWNCIKTNTIIFFSQNYSYKVMAQASGRIDRLNTPFTDLFYYHLKTRSGIDLAISRALANKKKFNEGGFANRIITPVKAIPKAA